jgi:hypothetical protein
VVDGSADPAHRCLSPDEEKKSDREPISTPIYARRPI